jgi:hypothetical protein
MDVNNNLARVITPVRPVRRRREGYRSTPYDRRGGRASSSPGSPRISGTLPARSRRLERDLRAVQRPVLGERDDLDDVNPLIIRKNFKTTNQASHTSHHLPPHPPLRLDPHLLMLFRRFFIV